MTTKDELDERMARLREEWPVGSMVDNIMARIGPTSPRRVRRRGRLFAGLAATGLVAALGVAWLMVTVQPTTLLAAVQEGLKGAQSAHLVITGWGGRNQDVIHREEMWYRRGEGLRVESPGQVTVEDGKTQWTWRTRADGDELVVLRQRSPGFFTTQLPAMIALPEISGEWVRMRTPRLDRVINGRACRGFTLTMPVVDRKSSPVVQPVDRTQIRALVLAEPAGRIHQITVQELRDDGNWRRTREIQIEYDLLVPAENAVARLPEGARVVDVDKAFHDRYPLDRALHKVELGGLILAVHDLQPLRDREGFYVVTSVRGTPEFLKNYPPRRRPLNPEVVLLDVAFQPMTNGTEEGGYDRIVLGNLTREGIEFSWWLIGPSRPFQIVDGKRVDLPKGEPARLDNLAGKARVPLSATYWDETHRDANGTQQGVSTWAEVSLPPDRPPTTLDVVAGHARRDMLLMGSSCAGGLLGVAADTKRDPNGLRPLSRFAAEAVSDADFVAAVRRGWDDLDEVRKSDSEPDQLPPFPGNHPTR